MTGRGINLGIVGAERARRFAEKGEALDRARAQARGWTLTPAEASRVGLLVNADGQRRNLVQLLAYPGATLERFAAIWPEIGSWPREIAEQIEIDALYAGYLDRQAADAEAFRREEALVLPPDLDYAAVGGLSHECREKLMAARPVTLGQAGRIEGVTPGALTALLSHVRKSRAA